MSKAFKRVATSRSSWCLRHPSSSPVKEKWDRERRIGKEKGKAMDRKRREKLGNRRGRQKRCGMHPPQLLAWSNQRCPQLYPPHHVEEILMGERVGDVQREYGRGG